MNALSHCRNRLSSHVSLAAVPLTAAAVASSIACRARFIEPFSPVLERVTIAHRSISPGIACLRIGFVTDTHVGPTIRAADVDKAMRLLFDAGPELLLFGGDFICESPRFIPEIAAVLRSYAALPPLGALAVFGNHDYSNDASRLQTALERSGVRILRNEGETVVAGDRRFWIAGIDDAILGRPRPELAFADQPFDSSAVALWHEPDWANQTASLGAILQLSGHSHGGQIRLPAIGHVAAPFGGQRFVAGLNNISGMPVYTSHGVGTYRPPVRFRCHPEVTLLQIHPANERVAAQNGNNSSSVSALNVGYASKPESIERG